MHYKVSTLIMDFASPEEHAATARRVQERMLEQGLPVPAISEVMLGLVRGRFLEFLEPPPDAETKES